jgi:hypothetical protein
MTLKELATIYVDEFSNKKKTVDKKIIKIILKKTIDNKDIKHSNIVDIHVDEITSEELLWKEIVYTFFYTDKKEIFYIQKRIFLVHYIAADYQHFTVDMLVGILNDIGSFMEYSWYVDDIKKTFLICLNLNKNLSDEVKLWLKLKQ